MAQAEGRQATGQKGANEDGQVVLRKKGESVVAMVDKHFKMYPL